MIYSHVPYLITFFKIISILPMFNPKFFYYYRPQTKISVRGSLSRAGGSLSRGSLSKVFYYYRPQTKVSVRGSLSRAGGSLSRGSLSRRWGSLSKGESLSSGGLCLCPEGGLSPGGLCPGGLCPGESVRETSHTVKSGQYASYWNAFLFYFVPS